MDQMPAMQQRFSHLLPEPETMRNLSKMLEQKKTLVSDGAWGTFLHKQGLNPGECPEAWNKSNRDKVAAVARSYVECGSDIILTNSFGANPVRLAHFNLEDDCYELNRLAAEISRHEAGEEILVFGSIGPSGEILGMGLVTEDALYEGFCTQARALADGGADLILVETMTDPAEAILAVRAAKKSTTLPVACTFTFTKTAAGQFRTMTGAGIEQALSMVITEGAEIIGTNCGNGFKEMIDIVREIRGFNTQLPVLVHANAGIPIYTDGKTVYPDTPDLMAELALPLVHTGTDIIGGCCGTGPEHISAIIQALREQS